MGELEFVLEAVFITNKKVQDLKSIPSNPSARRQRFGVFTELATGWKAGSGFHSALGRLATPEFIYEKSLLSS